MLLGKRPRPQMKPTTSMKDVSVALGATVAVSKPSDPKTPAPEDGNQPSWALGEWNPDRRRNVTAVSDLVLTIPPRGIWRSSADCAAVETAPFLRACALCKGLLHPGRDIFMYRGEVAFCSSECRGRQIKLDERKEKAKCSVASRKDLIQALTDTAASEASGSGEAVATG